MPEAIHVSSEIGRLRRVLLQCPGGEIDRMVPSMMEQLLFDDILDGDQARMEHDGFRDLLRSAGVETLDARDMLADVLASDEVRGALFAQYRASSLPLSRKVSRLERLTPGELADALVSGLRSEEEGSDLLFALPPVPNYFFQRDPQVVVRDRVMISSMATPAREREPQLARLLFEHHPALAGCAGLFEIEHPQGRWAGRLRRHPYPTLEGGDVLVADADTLLVGISERTNRRGVEVLARHLRGGDLPLRNLVLVDLPPRRTYMHLDTVFTFIDHGQALAHLPVIDGSGVEAASVYQVDLTTRNTTFTVRSSLRKVLADLGHDVELVPCGGGDPMDQEREQWTDGANAFAVAPGVIFLYRRNRRTLDELSARGWRILGEEEVLEDDIPLLGHGPTVVTLLGNELSRARGGPRCMTMPLLRDEL